MTKCPKCEKILTYVNNEAVAVGMPLSQQWRGLAHTCPYCYSALSIEIDPIAIRTDILNGVEELLKKHLRKH